LIPTKPAEAFEAAWVATQEVKANDRSLELRAYLGRRPDAWFLFHLLGPTRKAAADVWAVNKRALEIMVEFLKTPDNPPQSDRPWLTKSSEEPKKSNYGSL
jgi:hypothetical protein